MTDIITNINGLSSTNKQVSSQGLIIQNYTNSVLQQPNVDFTGFDNLSKFQTGINEGLASAKDHAKNYLYNIQPMIITNITNMSNYFALQSAIPVSLPQGATKKQWIDTLTAVRDQSLAYQDTAQSVVSNLQTLHGNFSNDAAHFNQVVEQLNIAVNGDNGVLQSLDQDLSNIQSKIDGAIAGAVLSGLAVVGGTVMLVAGTVSTFLTAGTSTPLAVAGGVVLVAGVAGAVASGIAIASLSDQKAEIINKQSKLRAEVKLAQGISGSFGSLNTQLKDAITATNSMQNAWSLLAGDLNNLANNLNSGIISTDALRTLFLNAADTELKVVKEDIEVIKGQMTGVQTYQADEGQQASAKALELLNAA